MQIDKKFRIEKAVSTDANRECLQNIWTSRRHAFATDGKILAAIPVTSQRDDAPGWLTPEALKLARRAFKGTDSIVITLNGRMVLPGGVTLPRPEGQRFPRVYQLFRRALADKRSRIALNASQLKDLADALGNEEIVLEFGENDKAVLVRPINESSAAVGLIMPIKLKNERKS